MALKRPALPSKSSGRSICRQQRRPKMHNKLLGIFTVRTMGLTPLQRWCRQCRSNRGTTRELGVRKANLQVIFLNDISWWYWALTDLLLFVGLFGSAEAFYAAVAISLLQVVHFILRESSITAFPVQVRVSYAAILLLALWPPLRWLYCWPAVGTLALVLFGYCFLARCLSLLPRNRREPLSWPLVWRTFTARPVKGNILHGLPAPRGMP